ncbi:CtrA inhibitor SciP [Pseudaestuariivita sp.]|uniref:CtrA inhibitor SciP n=1 Tax=Pseudaestuariivita sp. TaxID=2211669 RepID=UPI004057E2DA
MFLKKVDGSRAVTLPDGRTMTRADLPAAGTRRWVASRKAAVIRGVAYGLMSQEEALELYGLSNEEFAAWVRLTEEHGEEALRSTALQKYRSAKV